LLLSCLSLQKNKKPGATTNSEEFWRHWMLTLWRTLEKDNSTIVQPPFPLLWFVSAIVQEQQLWLRWYSSIHGINLKLLPNRTITKSSNKSLVIWSSLKRLFFDMLAINNVSFTPLYKGVKTWRIVRLSQQFLHVPKLCWNCSTSNVHLEFLNNFHIFEILES